MVNAMVGITDETFDRQRSSRMPADYPANLRSYVAISEIARRRQSAALQELLGGTGTTNAQVAERLNAALGPDRISSIAIRNLRSGNTIMTPSVAVAMAGAMDVSARDVLPHIEAYPWLRGRFRAELSGRPWVTIASRFDDALIGVFEGPPTVDADPSEDGPSQVARIMQDIKARMANTASPCMDSTSAAFACDDASHADQESELEQDGLPVPPVPSRRPPPATGGSVMVSLSDTPMGLRFFYRGFMHPGRVAMLEHVLRDNAWPLMPNDVLIVQRVEGRASSMVRCDLEVERRLGPRLLSALGRPLARRGLLSRLLGKG